MNEFMNESIKMIDNMQSSRLRVAYLVATKPLNMREV